MLCQIPWRMHTTAKIKNSPHLFRQLPSVNGSVADVLDLLDWLLMTSHANRHIEDVAMASQRNMVGCNRNMWERSHRNKQRETCTYTYQLETFTLYKQEKNRHFFLQKRREQQLDRAWADLHHTYVHNKIDGEIWSNFGTSLWRNWCHEQSEVASGTVTAARDTFK